MGLLLAESPSLRREGLSPGGSVSAVVTDNVLVVSDHSLASAAERVRPVAKLRHLEVTAHFGRRRRTEV